MDIYSIIERLKTHVIPIILGLAGVILLIIGFFSLIAPKKETSDIVFEPASTISTKEEEKKITVDVEGGVVKPGVYTLSGGARIQDAVIAAGGMSSEAHIEAVARTLNLAAKLTDGAKIYIPMKGDLTNGSGLTGNNGGQDTLGSATINLNSASPKELDSLPGIGEVTAQKVINARPYGSIDELLSKKIVSKKVFDQIKDKVSVF